MEIVFIHVVKFEKISLVGYNFVKGSRKFYINIKYKTYSIIDSVNNTYFG